MNRQKPSLICTLSKPIALACLLALLHSTPALSAIGDITHVVNAPNFTIRDNFAYDPVANQFHGRYSPRISVLDIEGVLLKQGTISGSLDDELDALTADGFLVEGGNIWVGLGQGLLTRWQLNEDENDELFLTEVGQTDLSHLLNINRNERLVDMALNPDGSILFYGLASSPSERFLLHTSADGVTQIARISLDSQLLFGFGGPSDFGPYLGVDLNGNVILRGTGFRPPSPNDASSANEFDSFWYIASRNGTELSLLGRFAYLSATEITVGNGVLFRQQGNQITGFELSAATLPQFSGISFDPKGVLWDNGCPVGAEEINTVLTVSVNWADPSGRILISTDSASQSPSFPSLRFLVNGWSDATVDGTDVLIPYSIDGFRLSQQPNPPLWIEVMNEQGQTSGLVQIDSEIAAYRGPVFSLDFGAPNPCPLISYQQTNQVGKWSVGGRWPAAPLEGTVTFPSFFPFVGGDSFGVKDLSAELSGAIASDGEEKVVLSGGGAFALGPVEIGMRLGGGATTDLTPTAIEYPSGLISLAISGAAKKEIGLLDAFPPAASLLTYLKLKPVIELANRVAKLEGVLSILGESTFKIAAHPVDGSLSLDGENEYALALLANANSNLAGDVIEVSAYGEGRTAVTVGQSKTAPGQMELRKIALRFLLSAKISFWGAVREFAQPYVWESDFTQPASTKKLPQWSDSGWEYRYGDKAGLQPKSVVTQPVIEHPNPFQSLLKVATKALGDDQVQTLMSGVGATAKPQAAVAPDGTAMVVWEQEVAGLPATQASDIYFSYFDGRGYSPPAPVNSDALADFTPTVAYHHSGVWIALWEQVNRADLMPSGDALADAETQINHLVPAYAVFDPATGVWAAPTQLATEGTHLHTQLATGPTHDVTAMWIHDPLQRLVPYDFGDPAAPAPNATEKNELQYARFTGGEFEPVREVNMGPNILFLDFTAADNGLEIAVAAVRLFAADFDAGISANADLLIGVNTISSGGNSFFTRYSNQNGFNRTVRLGPKIVAMNDGSWRLLWKQFDQLRISDDLSNFASNHRVLAQHTATGFDPFAGPPENQGSRLNNAILGDAGDGNAYVIVPDYTGDQSTLSLVFDDAQGLPSGALSLQLDDALEKSVSVATGPDGTLLVTYLKTEPIRTEVAIDEGGGVVGSYTRVVEADTGSVTILSHNIFTDLVVDQVDIVGGLAETGFDTTIEATIHNRGDLSVSDPRVSVFVRPQGASAKGLADIQIADNLLVVDGLMAGHSRASVRIPWTVPTDGNYSVFAVVDPSNDIIEAFESNNNTQPQPLGDVFARLFSSGFED